MGILLGFFATGVAVGLVGAIGVRFLLGWLRKPSESELIGFADELDAVEKLWAESRVGVGYSIDYHTGVTDVTIRVPNCGEDVTFRVEVPTLARRRRPIDETLGITRELPPSLRGDA